MVMVGPTLLYRFSVTPGCSIMLPKLPVSLSGRDLDKRLADEFIHLQPFPVMQQYAAFYITLFQLWIESEKHR